MEIVLKAIQMKDEKIHYSQVSRRVVASKAKCKKLVGYKNPIFF
jgi:hypothetical protein